MFATTVSAVECFKCGDWIYSRAHHDHHRCTCGAVFVDGGFDYLRLGWDDKKVAEPCVHRITVGASKQEMFEDWSSGANVLGWIIPADRIHANWE